jgi:hypothetical protein
LTALKTAQQLITALNRGVQRLLRRFLPGPYAFQFFIHDGADLRHIAQTQTFGERQRRFVQHLTRRDIRARFLS